MPIRNGRLECWNGHDLGDASDEYRDPDCEECARRELEEEVEREEQDGPATVED